MRHPGCFFPLVALALQATAQAPAPAKAPPSPIANISYFGPIWGPRCEKAVQTPLPAEANITAQHEIDPSGAPIGEAASMAFYYGIDNHPQDYVAARRAAWKERVLHDAPGISSTLVLAMIYANGFGTPRDPALAVRMACEAGLMPAELQRISNIANGPTGSRFDLCPAGSDAVDKNRCGILTADLRRQHEYDQINTLAATWPQAQRDRVRALETASGLFFRLSSAWEVSAFPGNSSASGDNFFALSIRRLHDLFVDLTAFEAHHPRSTTLPLSQADSQLNMAYQHLLNQIRQGTLETNAANAPIYFDVATARNIQRAWIAYRDAWAALIVARYGEPAAAAWKAQLTADRLHTLQALSGELSPISPAARPWLEACARLRNTPLPADETPDAAIKIPTCNSAQPYYGLDQPVDFAAARACAFQERSLQNLFASHAGLHDSDPADEEIRNVAGELNGNAILTMIYANGEGVPRNASLAGRFACEAIDDGQISDTGNQELTVDQLGQLYTSLIDATQKAAAHLNLCNFVPGLDRLLDECEQIARIRSTEQLDHELAHAADSFTPPQRETYLHLVAALRAYYVTHDNDETAVMGHFLFSGGWVGIHAEREQAFLKDLQYFEQGHLPHFTAADYASSDRALNAAFQKTLATAAQDTQPPDHQHTVGDDPTPATLRSTERLWLAYRDAWAVFAHLRYPAVSRESFLTWITRQHTADISDPCFFDATC